MFYSYMFFTQNIFYYKYVVSIKNNHNHGIKMQLEIKKNHE